MNMKAVSWLCVVCRVASSMSMRAPVQLTGTYFVLGPSCGGGMSGRLTSPKYLNVSRAI